MKKIKKATLGLFPEAKKLEYVSKGILLITLKNNNKIFFNEFVKKASDEFFYYRRITDDIYSIKNEKGRRIVKISNMEQSHYFLKYIHLTGCYVLITNLDKTKVFLDIISLRCSISFKSYRKVSLGKYIIRDGKMIAFQSLWKIWDKHDFPEFFDIRRLKKIKEGVYLLYFYSGGKMFFNLNCMKKSNIYYFNRYRNLGNGLFSICFNNSINNINANQGLN